MLGCAKEEIEQLFPPITAHLICLSHQDWTQQTEWLPRSTAPSPAPTLSSSQNFESRESNKNFSSSCSPQDAEAWISHCIHNIYEDRKKGKVCLERWWNYYYIIYGEAKVAFGFELISYLNHGLKIINIIILCSANCYTMWYYFFKYLF